MATVESFEHSPFVDLVPDFFLYGLLRYEPSLFGRGLGFYGGSEVDGSAFLTYQAIPAGALTTTGSVNFYLTGSGGMELLGSSDGLDWELLGTGIPDDSPQLFTMPIDAGDPAQLLSLHGYGHVTMDELQITIEFVPEPSTALLLAAGLVGLAAGRRRHAL